MLYIILQKYQSNINELTFDLENENHEESKSLYPSPRFKRVQKVYCKDGCLFCSCNRCQRYGIDCAHVFHILS